ncbi:hypothetical protein DSO57_1025207 [Entomophthora muscae]|uniref:Uncharacterized protein n=1 Tax=Entomophthora muscae TaxID=34485 RepID=A0ACC2S462_9FUNG|nr:hypothetical protein DSO57_1025207 [Entomophthora muscae]
MVSKKKIKAPSIRSEGTYNGAIFHTMDPVEAADFFETDLEQGLTSEQAKLRLAQSGPNQLNAGQGVSALKILLHQIANVLTIILTIAFVVVVVAGDIAEAVVIALVIFTNSGIGFMQEYKAEKTMESLNRLAAPTSNAIRDGQQVKVATNTLVTGDLVVLETGDVVGADLRLIEQFNLAIDEALLTGESIPAEKDISVIPQRDVPVGDRVNLAFSSTTVVKGRGRAIVIATGMDTEIGSIARTLNNADNNRKTSLAKTMDNMALVIFVLAILLSVVVFWVNKWQFTKVIAVYAVALSIAIIPEGLVVVVTLTMAAGVKKMVKNRAIIRRLAALETLGSVTNICSDKTGTLTQAKMVLTRLWLPGVGYFSVTGAGYNPEGVLLEEGFVANDSLVRNYSQGDACVDKTLLPEQLLRLTQVAALCNTAQIKLDSESGVWMGLGDPTENALQTFAHKMEMGQPKLLDPEGEFQFELLAEFPFDSSLKLMSAVFLHRPSMRVYVYSKGAIERLLPKAAAYYNDGNVSHSDDLLAMCTPHMEHLAKQGLRTLCLAFRELPTEMAKQAPETWTRDMIEEQLIVIGLVGIYDPPRAESRASVLECHRAGISVHMLTGDHPATAAAIARDVAILPTPKEGQVGLDFDSMAMTATQFDALSEQQLDALPALPLVVARCSPDTKVKMIHALHRRKLVVAMTGDGVNDSPSLKIANVGIGMGLSGSDVAKQASDIVLTDDNFATIVRAVGEGRRIFENIVKFVLHLMGGNASEIVVLVFGLLIRDKNNNSVFPMSAIQILCLNMFTSSPPAMGLGLEPAHPKSMVRPPRPVKGGLFTLEVIVDILFHGLVMGGLTLINFFQVVDFANPKANLGDGCNDKFNDSCEKVFQARAAAYACLTCLILLHAFNCRSMRRPAWSFKGMSNIYSNRFLFWSIVFGIGLLFPSIYIPYINETVFHHHSIGVKEWGIVAVSCIIFLALADFYKLIKRLVLKSDKIVQFNDEKF